MTKEDIGQAEATRRWASPVYGRFDATGELVEETSRGPAEPLIEHSCGRWTWEKVNYCVWCGERLEVSA